ncbi:hypothetical protein AB0L05_08285 [Nonomuraea pusilla]
MRRAPGRRERPHTLSRTPDRAARPRRNPSKTCFQAAARTRAVPVPVTVP